jgi:hypothetical protein
MLPLFEWLENLQFGASLDEAGYLVASINVMHLLSLAVFLGAALIVDFRLLGQGLTREPVAKVARDANPWLLGGLAATAVSGILQILATPMKAYYSSQFWLKMGLLIVALILLFLVRRRVTRDGEPLAPALGAAAAIASIVLWMTIAVEGRLIGLLQ